MEEGADSVAWPRVGLGWDVHRMVSERPLMLAGVHVPHDRGLLGHSDGDVVLHAVTDAVLGAAGLDDIGQLFPDTDPAYAGADSAGLLEQAVALAAAAGYRPIQVDAVVIAQRPKLADHKPAMRARLAELLGLSVAQANVKAKTAEGMGEVGEGDAIICQAVVLMVPTQRDRTSNMV